MKKLLVSILLLISVVVMVCGCGGTTKDPSQKEPEKHVVSDAVITEAFLSYRYNCSGFSITLRELLPKCCPDYKGSFSTYEGTKTEHLDEAEIANFENGEYKEYLNNAYFVTIGGPIMENPDIPYLVTEKEVILKLLIIFDENDKVVAYSMIESCSQLETCAILLMF